MTAGFPAFMRGRGGASALLAYVRAVVDDVHDGADDVLKDGVDAAGAELVEAGGDVVLVVDLAVEPALATYAPSAVAPRAHLVEPPSRRR